jgi:uncharacterized membrane protein
MKVVGTCLDDTIVSADSACNNARVAMVRSNAGLNGPAFGRTDPFDPSGVEMAGLFPRASPPDRRDRRRAASRLAIAALFVAAGALHFVIPRSYAAIVPPAFPAPLLLVYVSGVCEVLGGAGVLIPRTRRWAAIGLVALLAAVFPANVQMLLNAVAAGKPAWQIVLLTQRLPLQLVLMYFVWWAAGRRAANR